MALPRTFGRGADSPIRGYLVGRHSIEGKRHLAVGQFDASFWRYLAGFGIFSVGIFIFDELYPLYLLDRGHSVVVIGNASLALHVGSIAGMFAPALLAAWGAIRSVRFIMFAAGACSFLLSMATSTLAAGIGYATYMGFVAMAQPALSTLLMNQVREDEQAGASMMNSLFVFSAVAAGGFTGGRLIDVLGYVPMLALAGACCMLAAVVFVVLVKADPR